MKSLRGRDELWSCSKKENRCEAVSAEMKSKIFSLALCLPAAAGALRRNQASWSFHQLKQIIFPWIHLKEHIFIHSGDKCRWLSVSLAKTHVCTIWSVFKSPEAQIFGFGQFKGHAVFTEAFNLSFRPLNGNHIHVEFLIASQCKNTFAIKN